MHAVNMVMCGLFWCKTVAIGMFAMLQKRLVRVFHKQRLDFTLLGGNAVCSWQVKSI